MFAIIGPGVEGLTLQFVYMFVIIGPGVEVNVTVCVHVRYNRAGG